MQNQAYQRTALACFRLAHEYVNKTDPRTQLTDDERSVATCEIVCMLLHFLSRLFYQANPRTLEVRMSALATAALQIHTQEARNCVSLRDPSDPSLPPGYGADNRVVSRDQYEAARS